MNPSYILEPYKGLSSRHSCPKCKKPRVFTRYIEVSTDQPVHPDVGRCNRENNCGYHYTPRQFFEENPQREYHNQPLNVKKTNPVVKPVSYFPIQLFQRSLMEYSRNHFIHFLVNLFGQDITRDLISRYFIGTSKYWEGATLFWQIDSQGKIRTGKIMLYNPDTGKRIKKPYNHITWAHKASCQEDYHLHQCLFGEHLLKQDYQKPVALVESEKTAIISGVYLPQYIWLAAGSLNNINPEICAPLKNRQVTLFPDLSGFDKWESKSIDLKNLGSITVSDLLERKATEVERIQGLDLADYLVRFPLNEFLNQDNKAIIDKPDFQAPDSLQKDDHFSQWWEEFESTKNIQSKPTWDNEIQELEKFFSSHELPKEPIRIKPFTITDIDKFIDSHLAIVKANNGNPTFQPYLKRLGDFYLLIENSSGH